MELLPGTMSLVEPLSRATQQSMTPVKLHDQDYLELELDEDGKYFITQARALTLAPNDPSDIRCRVCGARESHWAHSQSATNGHEFEPHHIIEVNGQSMVPHHKGPSSQAAVAFARKVPERTELGFGRYKMAATDFTVVMITVNWPKERILFADREAELMFEYISSRFRLQGKRAGVVANFKQNGIVPEMPRDFIEHNELPMADYQKTAFYFSLFQEACGLFQDAGTGKTAVVINRVALESHYKQADKIPGVSPSIYRTLVICPRQVQKNWSREFERFSTVPGKVGILRGSPVMKQRTLIDLVRKEDDCNFGTAIISLDSVHTIYDTLKIVPWDLIVIDESHYCKNPSAKRTKWARSLGSQPNVRQRMVLTGTPIANTVMDLYAQFEFLGEGLSGFLTFDRYKKFHGQYERINKKTGQKDDSKSAVNKLVGIQNVPLLQERIARLCFCITKEEAGLNLPDKVYDIYEVDMTKKQRDLYNKMANDLVLEIEELLETDQKVSIDHILTKMLRLAQVCSGHVVFTKETDPDTGEERPSIVQQVDSSNPKVDAVLEMLQDEQRDPNGKTIIWCTFIEDMRILSEALHEAGIAHVGYHKVIQKEHRVPHAEDAEKVFNEDRDVKVFIGNPASGGVGLNFLGYDRERPDEYDTYTDHMIRFSMNWSATEASQGEDRAHRRGTRMPVRITDLMVPGTIDEEIRQVVKDKRDTALAVQDVRSILKNILKYESDD